MVTQNLGAQEQNSSQRGLFLDCRPTVTSAGWLFLVSFGLAAIAGGVLQSQRPGLGLILTEILFILLPTLIALRIGKYSIRETLQLRWPPLSLGMLSLLVGISLRPIAVWVANITYEILQISPFAMADKESTPLQTNLLLVGLVILAPICEETLFRGFIQSAFSKRGAWSGIIISGLLFVVFHQSLVSAPALLPLALVAGIITWRSNSLIPAIILHMGYNGMLPLVLIINPALERTISGAMSVGVSLAVTLAALWPVWRITRPTQVPRSPEILSSRWVFILIAVATFALFSLTSVGEILVLTGKLP